MLIDLKEKIIQNSDAIICISENTKKDLLEFYKIDEKKIFVSYLGYDHISNNFSLQILLEPIKTTFSLTACKSLNKS